MLPTARCQVVDTSAPHVPVSAALAHALTMGAVLIDVASLPAEHDMSHISPLRVSTMRPLALNADDPTSVHVLWTTPRCPFRRYVMRRNGWDRHHRCAVVASNALSRWFVAPRCRNKYTPIYSVCISIKRLLLQPQLHHENGGRVHRTESSWPGQHSSNRPALSFGCFCFSHHWLVNCPHAGAGP